MDKLRVLDLFAGIGGFSVGLERTGGFETVAFCEIESYPQKVLAKNWPGVPIYDDVRELTAERLVADGIGVDVITGGFPCQDISAAGNQAGIGEGTRSGLWSECARLLGELRPRYAIFENVTALLSGDNGRWFEQVLWDISSLGYDAEWHCIPASELGAHHHRDRVWIICSTNSLCGVERPKQERKYQRPKDNTGICQDVADTPSQRQPGQGEHEQSLFAEALGKGQTANALPSGKPEIWKAEPELGRVVDGVSSRSHSHRLKCLGNAVVPQIPELIGRAILEAGHG